MEAPESFSFHREVPSFDREKTKHLAVFQECHVIGHHQVTRKRKYESANLRCLIKNSKLIIQPLVCLLIPVQGDAGAIVSESGTHWKTKLTPK